MDYRKIIDEILIEELKEWFRTMAQYSIRINRQISSVYSVDIGTMVDWSDQMDENDKKIIIDAAVTHMNEIGKRLVQHYAREGGDITSLPGTTSVIKTFEEGSVTANKMNGKIYVKALVPGFEKHGINIWPETLKPLELTPQSILAKGDFIAYNIKVEFIDGKPKRVTGFDVKF